MIISVGVRSNAILDASQTRVNVVGDVLLTDKVLLHQTGQPVEWGLTHADLLRLHNSD